MTRRSLVSVIGDNESVRESLADLLREFGFAVRSFSSAEDLLASDCPGQVECLILDVVMSGMPEPQLHRELIRRKQEPQIIYITAHANETLRRKEGVACLIKPFFSEAALLSAINLALSAN